MDCAVNPKQDVRKIALVNMPSTRRKEDAKARKNNESLLTIRDIRKAYPARQTKRRNA